MDFNFNQVLQDNFRITFSCINSRLEDVEKDLMNLLVPFGDEWKKESYKLSKYEQVKMVLQEPDSKSIKFLLWRPQLNNNNFTIFINNFTDGWVTLLNDYSSSCKKEIIMATLSDANKTYPIYRFYYRKESAIRNVQALKEIGKWEFYQEGKPLPIEEVINYQKRKIANRLNNNIIESYMKKLGFDYSKKEFWLSKGDAIEYKFILQE